MRRITAKNVQQVLSRRLKLKRPSFKLERMGRRINGRVIDSAFRRMDDLKRQNKIMDALEAEFGPSAIQLVGMILAYTPEEWDLPLEGKIKPRTRKAG